MTLCPYADLHIHRGSRCLLSSLRQRSAGFPSAASPAGAGLSGRLCGGAGAVMSSTEHDIAKAERMQRELDITINQRLNIQYTDRDTSAAAAVRRSSCMVANDISSFARFLTDQKCLEVLLFWKEVEQFKSLFSREEKAALFSKIYELYCEPGALWQVNFKGSYFTEIKAAMEAGGMQGDVDDDVFDAAQLEVYELMRLDLFPRFQEKMDGLTALAETAEERAASVAELTSGVNPAATRSFMRFAKEQMCEEALLFWLEANDYALLFQPMDQQTRGQAIYDSYLGSKAKTKVNVSDRIIADVCTALESKQLNSALFVAAQKEIITYIEQDLFGRYETWYDSAGGGGGSGGGAVAASLLDEDRLGDRERMREALVGLISVPAEVEELRVVARDRDAEESLDFYIDAKKFTLLFADKVRRSPRAPNPPARRPRGPRSSLRLRRWLGASSPIPRAAHLPPEVRASGPQ